jgi:hypothetical protein
MEAEGIESRIYDKTLAHQCRNDWSVAPEFSLTWSLFTFYPNSAATDRIKHRPSAQHDIASKIFIFVDAGRGGAR